MREGLPHNITEEQLARFFAGEATAQESQEIQQWANMSQENKDHLLQMQVVWIDTGHVSLDERGTAGKYDVEGAWAKVRAKKMESNKKAGAYRGLWKIAAAVVLVVGLGLLARYLLSPPEEVVYLADAAGVDLELPDGTHVILDEHTSLTYPETFGDDERSVRLIGKAFFQVQHNPEQPFIIKAGPTFVKVLGTSFYVNMDSADVAVLVESGKVLFYTESDEKILTAGDQAVFSAKSSRFSEAQAVSSVGEQQFWRTRTLRFTGQKLPAVVSALEAAYGVQIRIINDHLRQCSLSVTFEDDSLDNILEVISMTLDLQVQKEDDKILISGEGCGEN